MLVQPDKIRNEWTGYYKNLYAEESTPEWDSSFKTHVENEIENINVLDRVKIEQGPITLNEVKEQICKMKRKRP